MTLEELKNEADKYGYKLVKKNSYIKILPCPVCGKKSTHIRFNLGGEYLKVCSICGFKGNISKTKRDVNKSWNDAVNQFKFEENYFNEK